MKKILLIAVVLVIYAAALLWKNGVIEEKKNRPIATTPEIQRNQGVPVNTVEAQERSFHKEFQVSGFLTKNGTLRSQVSPELISSVKEGVQVEIHNLEKVIKGVVTSISQRPDILTGLYQVDFSFKHFPNEWINKLNVVYIPYAKIDGYLVLPRAAVSIRDGQPKVYVVNSGRIEMRDVQIAETNNLYQAIRSGIAPGEEVVVSDQRYLQDKQKVKVVPPLSTLLGETAENKGAVK